MSDSSTGSPDFKGWESKDPLVMPDGEKKMFTASSDRDSEKIFIYNGKNYENWRWRLMLTLGERNLRSIMFESEDKKKIATIIGGSTISEYRGIHKSSNRGNEHYCETNS